MRGDERLDERIDAALRSYGEPGEIPEARVALARVLERARAEGTAQRRVWVWSWAVGAACVVALLVALGWMSVRQGAKMPEIARTPRAPGVVVPQPLPVRSTFQKKKPGRVRLAAGNVERPLPKLDVFPTPTPLSPQEQALAAFAQHGPPAVQRAVLDDQQHWDDPSIVADLQQPPQAGSPQDQ